MMLLSVLSSEMNYRETVSIGSKARKGKDYYGTIKHLFYFIRKSSVFKSLQLSCSEITQVIKKCQTSIGLSKILTCYLIQLYSLKRWICYRCLLKKLF